MTASNEGPLTQLARDIQTRNQQFQQELTEAALQAASDPAAALLRLDHCWTEADKLEQDDPAFLKISLNEDRVQILGLKAQVLWFLGRYDESQATITDARSRIADPSHPVSAMLDELEVAILQAKA